MPLWSSGCSLHDRSAGQEWTAGVSCRRGSDGFLDLCDVRRRARRTRRGLRDLRRRAAVGARRRAALDHARGAGGGRPPGGGDRARARPVRAHDDPEGRDRAEVQARAHARRGTCSGTRSATSTTTACGGSASSARSPPSWPATRTCSASRSSGAGSSAGSRCWWRRRTGSWVARPDPAIRTWSGRLEILPGVTLSQPGGHFPGSAVVALGGGADGKGVLLSGDTVFANPDRRPSRSCAATRTTSRCRRPWPSASPTHWSASTFDRLYGNFATGSPPTRGRSSAARRTGTSAWVRGDFDHLT